MQGAHEKALEAASRAAALAAQIGYAQGVWQARAVAGRAHRALNHTDEARLAFDEAIKTLEVMRAQAAGDEQGSRAALLEGLVLKPLAEARGRT